MTSLIGYHEPVTGEGPYRQHRILIAAVLILIALSPFLDHLITPSVHDSLNASSIFTLALPIVAVIYAMYLRPLSMTVSAALTLLLGVTLLGALHTLASPARMSVLAESGKVFSGFALLLLIPIAQRARLKRKTIRIFFSLLIMAVLSHTGVAVLQMLGTVEFTYFQRAGGVTLGRPSGSYFHPISLAFFMLFVMLFTNLLADRGLIAHRTRIILSVLSLAGIVMTTHRATLLIAIGVLVLYGLLLLVNAGRVRMLHIAMASVVLLGGALAVNWIPSTRVASLFGGLTDVISSATFDPSNSSAFLRGRGERWERTVAFISNAPIANQLFGVGYQPMDPHSDYLRILLVNGVIGVLATVVATVLLAYWLWGHLNRLGRLHLSLLMVVTAVFSLTTKPSTYTFYMWLATAFIILLLQLYPRHPQNSQQLDYRDSVPIS